MTDELTSIGSTCMCKIFVILGNYRLVVLMLPKIAIRPKSGGG